MRIKLKKKGNDLGSRLESSIPHAVIRPAPKIIDYTPCPLNTQGISRPVDGRLGRTACHSQ